MRITARAIVAALAAIFPLTVSAAELPSAAAAPKKVEDGVVARVNGTPIFRSSLDPLVEKGLRRIQRFSTHDAEGDPKSRLERDELDKLIGRELLFQAGMQLPNIDIRISEFMKADAENMAAQAAMKEKAKKPVAAPAKEDKQAKPVVAAEAKAEKPAAVAQDKLSPEEETLRIARKRTFVINEYLHAKGALTPAIPDEDAKQYYTANSANFFRPETVKASHILIKVEKGAVEKDVEAARKKAEEARAALVAGKKFDEVAKEVSACATAAKGGDLGVLKRGYMPREFDAVAFTAAVGEISAPVRTEHGFHIIRITEHNPEGIRSFDDVKEFIKGFLSTGARDRKYQEAINELKKSAVIEKAI